MSKNIAIKVETISKCYRIGVKDTKRDSFIMTIIDFMKSPWKNYRQYRSLYSFEDVDFQNGTDTGNNSSNIIWALKDISFDVKQGEVVGIIGRNGAGKSTLLKVLSRITSPTFGSVEIRGRVSSLLEVGTGFHPDLTGRENIYLNGTILGMRKTEIDKKLDDIIEFSGIEKFIDTPVKRYSSGMAVRLAFSVAAHLEPEILIIDEVLAVGDNEFQKKCLGKMQSVATEGRTVLFVSHNMGAVTTLCERAIWVENGEIKLEGQASDVVSSYLFSSAEAEGKAIWINSIPPSADAEAQISSCRILSEDNTLVSAIPFDIPFFKIEMIYNVFKHVPDLSNTFQVTNSEGFVVFESIDSDMPEWKKRTREPGTYTATCKVPGKLLKPDRYTITVCSFVEYIKVIDRHEKILVFEVTEVGYTLNPGRKGVIFPVLEWEIKREDIN